MSIGKINYKKILYRIEKFYSSFFFVNHTVGRQPGTLQIDAFKLWRLRRGAVSLAQGGFGVVRVPWHRVRGLIGRRSARFFRDFAVAGRLLLPATVKLVVPRGGSFVLSDGVRQSSLSAWRRFVSGVLSAFSQVACVTVQSFARGVILW